MAGELPPSVVSGQPIASAWGNSVVDELFRKRQEQWLPFSHTGVSGVSALGAYDLGTTTLPIQSYPQRVSVIANISWGYASTDTTAALSMVRFVDAATFGQGATYCKGGSWAHVPCIWSWSVAAGASPSFKTVMDLRSIGGGGAYGKATGIYNVQRYST